MINSDKSACLCNNYSKTLNRETSYFGIKDSYDFRDSYQLGLCKLLLIERFLIALARLHHIAYEMQATCRLPWSSMKSHTIAF